MMLFCNTSYSGPDVDCKQKSKVSDLPGFPLKRCIGDKPAYAGSSRNLGGLVIGHG
jgi:hypothetical protein